MDPNRYLVTILTFILTDEGSQAGLAAILEIDSGQLSRIKHGREPWPDRRLSIALEKLNHWARGRGSEQLVLRDLYDEDAIQIINKLSLPEDAKFRLIQKLRINLPQIPQFIHRTGPGPGDDPITKLLGIWVNLYICTNPNDRSQRAVAVDNFIISRSTEAFTAILRQTNYEHADGIIPDGTIRIRNNILEIDIDYKEWRFPWAKYLAPMPQTESVDHMLTASLDIKLRARTVVARPTLLVRIEEDVEQPGIFNQDTELFSAAKQFFTVFAPFDDSRNELCPRREVTDDDCAEIIAAVKRTLQGRPRRVPLALA